jgi:hypothetical protein
MEVLQLLPNVFTLQGVLPDIPPMASLSQGSNVDRQILYTLLVAGGRHKLAPWALWRKLSQSYCALSNYFPHLIFLTMMQPSYNEESEEIADNVQADEYAAHETIADQDDDQLGFAAQNLKTTTKMKIP